MASFINKFLFISSIFYLSFFVNNVFSVPNQDDIISQQANALLELKENLRHTKALDSTWIKGTNLCTSKWYGILCDDHEGGGIVELRLEGIGLSGDFSVESLKPLKSLRLINIANNLFTGHLPDFWVLEKSLRILAISNNKFDNVIKPDAFANMTLLRRIDLSRNQFVGEIPESLTTLPKLRNLNMSRNGFSGPLPVFPQESLKWLDLSINKLEGEIPVEMLRFHTEAYAGNDKLCSSKQGIKCMNGKRLPEPKNSKSREGESWLTQWVVLSVIALFILLTLFITKMAKDMDKNKSRRIRIKKADDEVHINIGEEAIRKSTNSSRSSGSFASKKSSRNLRSGPAELVIVNDERGLIGMPDLMKAAAEVLGTGAAGSSYKTKMSNGSSLVVKRVRQLNKLGKEDFSIGMRFLGKLRHKNILPPLAYHYRKDEKLIVSGYVERGSLMYILHGNSGKAHAELSWPIRLKIIKGVAQGLGFLHSQFSESNLPHGNLKSCNILLTEEFEPLLNDYALFPMVDDSHITQTLFAYKTPEAIFDGKVSPKSDVYCLGIVILEILTGKYPAQYLNNQSGGTDVVQWTRSAISEGREMALIDSEIIPGMESSVKEMEKLLHVGVACTEDDHDSRIGIEEAIKRIEEIQDQFMAIPR